RLDDLIDRLVVGFATDVGAKELPAVEEGQNYVLELHPWHFPRERHVAYVKLVFAVRGEIVLDDEAPARPERHAFNVMLLPARARSTPGRERDHHIGDVTVGGRYRRRFEVTDRPERNLARGVDVLVDEGRRHLKGIRVVVEVALDVVLGQQHLRIDVERQGVAYRVRIRAAIQAAQRDTAGRGLAGSRIDLVREPRNQPSHGLSVGPPFPGRR